MDLPALHDLATQGLKLEIDLSAGADVDDRLTKFNAEVASAIGKDKALTKIDDEDQVAALAARRELIKARIAEERTPRP